MDIDNQKAVVQGKGTENKKRRRLLAPTPLALRIKLGQELLDGAIADGLEAQDLSWTGRGQVAAYIVRHHGDRDMQ